MSKLDQLEKFTLDFKFKVQEQVKKKNREDLIYLVNKHLEERQVLINQMSGPYSADQKQQLERILKMDDEIQVILEKVFESIQVQMVQAKKQKTSNQQYLNPYSNVNANDGSYWDKKK